MTNRPVAVKTASMPISKTEELLDLPPDQRMKAMLKMSPEDQRARRSFAQRRQA